MSVSVSAAPRVLMLLNRVPYPLNDGGAIAMYAALKGYCEAGCKVHVLAMNTTKHFVKDEEIKKHISPLATGQTVFVDNFVTAMGAFRNLFSSRSYILSRFESKRYGQQLEELLKRQQFDLIHADGLPCMLYADTVKQNSKAVLVYRAHNVEHRIWERAASVAPWWQRIYLWIQLWRLKQFEIKALNTADEVFSISDDDAAYFKTVTDKRITNLPTGVEVVNRIQNANPSSICFIGSFDWLPNVQGMQWFLKDVWPELKEAIPNLQLNIAGKGLKKDDAALIGEDVYVEGEVESATEFLNKHGVVVVPLLSGSGIRIKIIEAMAMGKVVVATAIAAEGLGLTNWQNIVIANTPDEFVSAFQQIMSNPKLLQAIQQNAHTFVRQNFNNKGIMLNALKTIGVKK